MDREGNTDETLLNGKLAELLRGQGLDAEAEVKVTESGRNHYIDIVVDLYDRAVAIEAEYEPANTVRKDAEKRLPPDPLLYRGVPIDLVFKVVYPKALKSLPESESTKRLAESTEIKFTQGTTERDARLLIPKLEVNWAGEQIGTAADFADTLHNYWIQTAKQKTSVDEVVTILSFAIEQAAGALRTVPGIEEKIYSFEDADPALVTALIWVNALMFQHLLASNLDLKTLPAEHKGKSIPRPNTESHAVLLKQWEDILAINWHPIFAIARDALNKMPSPQDVRALRILGKAAKEIAGKEILRNHDIAGRIFHRLLNARKFLATNYTTIPAATMLAALAMDDKHWKNLTEKSFARNTPLRIVDPACGTGTLLMAVCQELMRKHRRLNVAGNDAMKVLLEEVIYGYDVVPSAIHLTAATLSMSETKRIIEDMPLYGMPHDVKDKVARLGSLDYLRSAPHAASPYSLFSDPARDAYRTTGTGEKVSDAHMPQNCDMIIANPPFVRAGGPGDENHTAWNPLFGSTLSKKDITLMNEELQRRLKGTAANTYAGLGSAFVLLAHERMKIGGRLAMILPTTAITGSRWRPIRKMLLENYLIDYVIASHDSKVRPSQKNLLGRYFVSFSESTNMGEVLIVATRVTQEDLVKEKCKEYYKKHEVKFVNIRYNPEQPIEALILAKMVIATESGYLFLRNNNKNKKLWGEIINVEQEKLNGNSWPYTALVQSALMIVSENLVKKNILLVSKNEIKIPIVEMQKIACLGPYHMQIKNPKYGSFDILKSYRLDDMGYPALWHHRANEIIKLEATANARLFKRAASCPEKVESILEKKGKLHFADSVRHNTQRLTAVITKEPVLGVSAWVTILLKNRDDGLEEALALWLNSTLGFLLRVMYSNHPYLKRSRLPHELIRIFPILNVNQLTKIQLHRAKNLWKDLCDKELQCFSKMDVDPVRRELDHRFFSEVLEIDNTEYFDELARQLCAEPMIGAQTYH